MKLTDQIKKSSLLQRFFLSELLVLILVGSIPTGKGSVWPFYVNKTGNTYGINLALVSEFSPGANHYGLNFSLATVQQEETSINGMNLTLVHNWKSEKKEDLYSLLGASELNGISISLGQLKDNKNPSYSIVRGVQLGLVNTANSLNGFQFGIYNKDRTRSSLFVNFNFE